MIIYKNSYCEESERLFSTGNPDLDDLLEEVYYSGISDGYDYFELEQREFARNKHNKTNAVKAGTEKAVAQGKAAVENAARLDTVAREIAEKHNGDVDSFLKSLKDQKRYNEYKSYKSRFSSGQGREDLENVLKGMKASDASTVKKAAQGVEANAKVAGDAVNALGKTRESVAKAGGLTREAGGQRINMQLDQNGRALMVSDAVQPQQGLHRGVVVTKADSGRAATVNREVSMPQQGGKVGKARRGSVPAKYRRNSAVPVNAAEGLQMQPGLNQTYASGISSLKGDNIGKISQTIVENGQVAPNSKVVVQNYATPSSSTVKTVPTKPIEQPKAPTQPKPRAPRGSGAGRGAASSKTAAATGGKVKGFLGKNKKALLIGTGVLGAGAIAGAALSNRNNRQQQ